MVFECLASIDEHYGDLIVIPLQQLRIGIDVHFAPLEFGVTLDLGKRLLHNITKMTALSRIHHDFVHTTIVSGHQRRWPSARDTHDLRLPAVRRDAPHRGCGLSCEYACVTEHIIDIQLTTRPYINANVIVHDPFLSLQPQLPFTVSKVSDSIFGSVKVAIAGKMFAQFPSPRK